MPETALLIVGHFPYTMPEFLQEIALFLNPSNTAALIWKDITYSYTDLLRHVDY